LTLQIISSKIWKGSWVKSQGPGKRGLTNLKKYGIISVSKERNERYAVSQGMWGYVSRLVLA
jgi:hypothetical protein